jgi:hypothetical protein
MFPSADISRPPGASTGAVRPVAAPWRDGRRAERGAVLVHVAVAMMGLLAFSAVSIDLGTLWIARGQAQNAADAAALSGGVSLAYIDETDVAAAQAAASVVAQQHSIWGAPVIPAEVTAEAGSCPVGSPGVAGICMGVRVSRDATSGTPLPVFFARLFGTTSTEMHASASAKVMLGNVTSCPRPLAIFDRWNDLRDSVAPVDGVWAFDDAFDAYDASGAPIAGVRDLYEPPSDQSTGSGWNLTHVRPSLSQTFRLPVVDGAPETPPQADQMVSFDLPRPDGSTLDVYRYGENLESCAGPQLSVGQTVATVYAHRPYYTVDPLAALIASDSGATWDDAAQTVRGSLYPVSPRLITIAVVDPDDYSRQNRVGGTTHPTLRVRNLVGFFVEDAREGPGGVHVTGRLTRTAGSYSADVPAVSDQSAFLRTVALVR